MKLAEAAHILGISLEEVTVDSLKQTYKKLMTHWDNEKVKDTTTRFRFLQINEAYQKLHSVMESKDEPHDDQHELANFMKMVMDIVGISDANTIPSAAMTFGMMFSSRQQGGNGGDEWSTDDELDHEDNEDDDDDYDQHSEDNDIWPSSLDHADQWEPQAKQYSNMNLKDEVVRARKESEKKNPQEDSAELEKRLKLAKKRAEKRKKQKEQKKIKQSEQSQESSTGERISRGEKSPEVLQFENILALANSAESIERIVNRQKDQYRQLLLESVQRGDVETSERLLQFNTSHENIPQSILEAVYDAWKKEFPSYFLFHRCITDTYQFVQEDPDHARDQIFDLLPETARGLIRRKVQIAQLLIDCKDPVIDMNSYDEQGLSVLHKSIVVGDMEFTRFVVNIIITTTTTPSTSSNSQTNYTNAATNSNPNTEKRVTINLNTRCRKKGWAPIHYAVDKSNLEAIRLLGYSGANLQATSATDKKLTPLELVKSRMKAQVKSSGAGKGVSNQNNDALNEVLAILIELIAWQKAQGKEEKKKSNNEAEAADLKRKESKTSAKTGEVPSSITVTATTATGSGSTVSVGTTAESTANSPGPTKPVEKKKKKKRGETGDPAASTATNSPSGPEQKQESFSLPELPIVASRDEIVDRLLAMGFQETDCLRAISRYGTDIDRAISFLCEGPAPPSSSTITNTTTTANNTNSNSSSTSASNTNSNSAGAASVANNNQSKAAPKKESEKGKATKASAKAPESVKQSPPIATTSPAPPAAAVPSNPSPVPTTATSTSSSISNKTAALKLPPPAKTVTPAKKKETSTAPAATTARASSSSSSSKGVVAPPPPGLGVSASSSESSLSNQQKTWTILTKPSTAAEQEAKKELSRRKEEKASISSEASKSRFISAPSENKVEESQSRQPHLENQPDLYHSPLLSTLEVGAAPDLPSLASSSSSHVIPGYMTSPSAQVAGVGMTQMHLNPLNGGIAYPMTAGIYYTAPYALSPGMPTAYSLSPAILVPGYSNTLNPLYPVITGSNSQQQPLFASPSSIGMDSGSFLSSSLQQETSSATQDVLIDESSERQEFFGAVELSVGAKPFVPKSFSASQTLSTSSSTGSHGANALLSSTTTPPSTSTTGPTASDLLSNFTGTPSTANPFLLDDLTKSLVNGGGDAWSNSVLPSAQLPSLASSNTTLSPSASLGNMTSLGDGFPSLGASPLIGGLGVGEGLSGLGNYFSSGLFGGLNSNSGSAGTSGLHGETFDFDVNRDILPELDSLLAKDLNDLTT